MTHSEITTNKRLSKQQTIILSSLANGKSPKEIASELYISVRTVRSHLNTIKSKLGALNTTHAVAIGIKRGILYDLDLTDLQEEFDSHIENKTAIDSFVDHVLYRAPWGNLTPRELEIFLAFGESEEITSLTNLEIGKICNASPNSMKQFNRRIKRNLGIESNDSHGRDKLLNLSRILNSLKQLQQK